MNLNHDGCHGIRDTSRVGTNRRLDMEDDGDASKQSKILIAIFKKRKFRRQIGLLEPGWKGWRREETMDLTECAFI